MANRRILITLLVVIGVLAFGAYQIWRGLHDANEARLSEQWPAVEGKVLSHSFSSEASRYGQTFYHPIVWYAYSVNNVPYKDSRIGWYSELFESESGVTEFMDRHYPIGSSVRVHYDPHHPHHACLIVGEVSRAQGSAYAALAMMGVAIVVGVFQLIRLSMMAKT